MAQDEKAFTFIDGRTYDCFQDDAIDPDVAGIGVMVSFWVSAALTFLFILYGYFGGGLPGGLENGADNVIKLLFKRLVLPRRKWDQIAKTKPNPRLQKGFEGFLLSLSDQQLVTGFAILVSMFSKGDITVYSFRVATGVAWLSSTIHMATLVILRR
ncbi:hypothetical protein GQ53DRAFT_824551 [Thozetella sp. PMI_491]|nr:hypothetical protein GQ53DRAFT_824551 [Thozetella sp. PMI_491]